MTRRKLPKPPSNRQNRFRNRIESLGGIRIDLWIRDPEALAEFIELMKEANGNRTESIRIALIRAGLYAESEGLR